MTSDEVGVMLQATAATVREAIRAGPLPAEKRSGTWRVRHSDVEELPYRPVLPSEVPDHHVQPRPVGQHRVDERR